MEDHVQRIRRIKELTAQLERNVNESHALSTNADALLRETRLLVDAIKSRRSSDPS